MSERYLTTVPIDLDDAFEAFMRKVFPRVPETSVQYWDCRRVYYVALATMFDHMCVKITELPNEDGFNELQNIQKQLDDFAKQLEKGNA